MFWSAFWILSTACVLFRLYLFSIRETGCKDKESVVSVVELEGRKLQIEYLIVYFLAVAADWLQGPYVYALYEEYGFSKGDIGLLFVAGFGSSAIFGTFAGSSADRLGRKLLCQIYGVLYSLSCITKHVQCFWVLLLGRILGGISTSILFSSFEAWLISEQSKRGLPNKFLNDTFAKAQFGNGLVAILAGQLANLLAFHFGKVSPFDASLMILSIMFIVISWKWNENYGDANHDMGHHFTHAMKGIFLDKKVLLLGIVQSCFEGVMYIFVFVWTPAMQHASWEQIPHGLIFSCFMVSLMIGSCMFALLEKHTLMELLLRNLFSLAAVLFTVNIISLKLWQIFLSFVCFEVICGAFFPAIAVLRARIISNETRSTVMSLFRIPLNVIVLVVLVADWSIPVTFEVCAALMVLATVSQQWLIRQIWFQRQMNELHIVESAEQQVE
eukprot:jgi/Galph1/4375/GphlegSOOS_G3069.1